MDSINYMYLIHLNQFLRTNRYNSIFLQISHYFYKYEIFIFEILIKKKKIIYLYIYLSEL